MSLCSDSSILFLPVLPKVYSFPLLIVTEENPTDVDAFQRMLGFPPVQVEIDGVSFEMPL